MRLRAYSSIIDIIANTVLISVCISMLVALVSWTALIAHRYSRPCCITTTLFASRCHPALSISTLSNRILSPATLPVPRGPTKLRITRRPLHPLPDNPVHLYSHPHLYLSTCSTHFLDAPRRQALLSALESEYSSAQSEFVNAPMCTITFVSSGVTATPCPFVRGEEALALASILDGSCSTSGFHGLIQNLPGTWNAR